MYDFAKDFMVDFMGSARVVLLSFTLVSFSVRIAAKRGGADAGGRWSSSHQPGLHIQSIIAKDPAAIDLAIVMMDNRHIASAGLILYTMMMLAYPHFLHIIGCPLKCGSF